MKADPRFLVALLALPLQSQAWAQQGESASYQFQLRIHRAQGDLTARTESSLSGGGGFMGILGSMPLKARLRLDGDDLPARAPSSSFRTMGFGAEALYLLPFAPDWEPYVALGPTLQHWEYRPLNQPGIPSRSFNHLAFRFEVGFWSHRHVGASAGVLEGAFEPGLRGRLIYLGINFRN